MAPSPPRSSASSHAFKIVLGTENADTCDLGKCASTGTNANIGRRTPPQSSLMLRTSKCPTMRSRFGEGVSTPTTMPVGCESVSPSRHDAANASTERPDGAGSSTSASDSMFATSSAVRALSVRSQSRASSMSTATTSPCTPRLCRANPSILTSIGSPGTRTNASWRWYSFTANSPAWSTPRCVREGARSVRRWR